MPFSSPQIAGLALLCVLSIGCYRWRTAERPMAFPVRGELYFNGKPAAGARVRLFAIGNPRLEGLCPHGEVDADGSFRLMTYQMGDGAPEGAYALTITWPLPPVPGKELGKDRFRGKYADPRRPVREVRVTRGENALDVLRLPGP